MFLQVTLALWKNIIGLVKICHLFDITSIPFKFNLFGRYVARIGIQQHFYL